MGEPDTPLKVLQDLARSTAREEARKEVASLCGLVLRRLGEAEVHTPLRGGGHVLQQIFGEALRDFSSDTNEPGPTASDLRKVD